MYIFQSTHLECAINRIFMNSIDQFLFSRGIVQIFGVELMLHICYFKIFPTFNGIIIN